MKFALSLLVSGVVMLGYSAITGYGLFMAYLFLGIGVVALVFTVIAGLYVGSKDQAWIDGFSHCKYKFSGNGSGIALDEIASKIHLREDDYSKCYDFKEVRSWNTNLQTGGMNNRKQEKMNSKSSGLFVNVKDVNRAEWRIKFSSNESVEKAEQTRWMEILTQVLNENLPAQPSQITHLENINEGNRSAHRFCISCGEKNTRGALFCEACGIRMSAPNNI